MSIKNKITGASITEEEYLTLDYLEQSYYTVEKTKAPSLRMITLDIGGGIRTTPPPVVVNLHSDLNIEELRERFVNLTASKQQISNETTQNVPRMAANIWDSAYTYTERTYIVGMDTASEESLKF